MGCQSNRQTPAHRRLQRAEAPTCSLLVEPADLGGKHLCFKPWGPAWPPCLLCLRPASRLVTWKSVGCLFTAKSHWFWCQHISQRAEKASGGKRTILCSTAGWGQPRRSHWGPSDAPAPEASSQTCLGTNADRSCSSGGSRVFWSTSWGPKPYSVLLLPQGHTRHTHRCKCTHTTHAHAVSHTCTQTGACTHTHSHSHPHRCTLRCVYALTYTLRHILTHMQMHRHTETHAQMGAHTQKCTPRHMQTHTVCMHGCMHSHACRHIHTRRHTLTYTHAGAYTDTPPDTGTPRRTHLEHTQPSAHTHTHAHTLDGMGRLGVWSLET